MEIELNKSQLIITYGLIIPVMAITGWFFPATLPYYFAIGFIIAIIINWIK